MYTYTYLPMYMYLKHNVLERREYKIMIGFPEKNVTTDPTQPVPFVLKYTLPIRTKKNQIKYNETSGTMKNMVKIG